MAEEQRAEPVFTDVVFAIIPSEDIGEEQKQELIGAIAKNGGHYEELRDGDQQVDNLDAVTHILSTHIDFPQYNAALQHGIHIVKPSWAAQSLVKEKQVTPRQHSPDPSQFFQDVVLTNGDLPEPDKDAIVAGVIALGGQYSGPLSRIVTHIATTNTDNLRCDTAREKKLNCKFVLPHWFDDCLKLGKKINEGPYMFPHPEILRSEHNSKPRETPSSALNGAGTANPMSPPPDYTPSSSPSDSRKNLSAFMCKSVRLADDLQLSEHLHKTLVELIAQGGGTVTQNVEEADIYIGQYRDGQEYVKASQAGKDVGNLSWLYHVINRNKYTSPLSKLLHYPIPRNGVPGFAHMRISVSNYNGDSRIYLENLINYCGAEFCRTLKQDNTHLVTAHTKSEKCEAAQEWNVNVINHLWLEESYAKCAVQTLSNARYTTFPARTNLGEVAGQTRLDMKTVERSYFSKRSESPQKQAQPSARKAAPSSALTMAASAKPASTTPATYSPAPADEDTPSKPQGEPEARTAKKKVGRPSKSASTPRIADDEKENHSPAVTASGRASKAKALGLLHGQADDIALYQKEMKRVGGVTHGGRRSSHLEPQDNSSPVPSVKSKKKRASGENTYDVTAQGSDLSDGETQPAQPAKKTKRGPATSKTGYPPVEHNMLVTGDERWLNAPQKENSDRQKLRQLGVQLLPEPNTKAVDILVAPKIRRTRKFVCALAWAPLVVDSKYLDSALKQAKLPANPKMLEDSEGEKQYGFKLGSALQRASENKRRLLSGFTIFVTRDVGGGFDTYKDVITINGGEAMLYQGRKGLVIPKRKPADIDEETDGAARNRGGEDEFDHVYLVSGISEPEERLWGKFRELAESQDLVPRVVANDWLLSAALDQRIIWDPKWELTDANVASKRKST